MDGDFISNWYGKLNKLRQERKVFNFMRFQFTSVCVLFQVTLIAQGDVPLSIIVTACTTLGAVLLTPFLTKILAGTLVPVDAIQLSISTLQVNWNLNKLQLYKIMYGWHSGLYSSCLGGGCTYSVRCLYTECISCGCENCDTFLPTFCCFGFIITRMQVLVFYT